MMLGEIDYNDLYYGHFELYDQKNITYENKTYWGKLKTVVRPQLFPITAQLFMTIFIVFMSIIIVNFLFGLAVYDVQVNLYYITKI